jgi:transcriptional regulator with XRE-family HTH domain
LTNELLRAAMVREGFTKESLAAAVDVQVSTVGRWLNEGRVPHPSTAAQAAALLKVPIYELWPSLTPKPNDAKTDPDLVCVYPQRGAVPESTWRDMVDTAAGNVDILVYSANFLTDGDADFPRRVKIRNAHGVCFRLLLGDPGSPAVALRGSEEGIGPNMGARIGLTLVYLRDLIGVPGIEMRLHGTALYNSIYRFDDHMLVNAHAYGAPAVQSPVLYLKRAGEGRLFRHYLASFDRVWETAKPVLSPYEGAK